MNPIRVLHYVGYPFAWAKGGHCIQVRESLAALDRLGVENVWLRHDVLELPRCDIMHYWGRPPRDQHWQLAKSQGMKLVISELHQQATLRPGWQWKGRGGVLQILRKAMPGIYQSTGAGIYRELDAAIAVSPFEARYMEDVFHAPPSKVHVVPNGVHAAYFDETIHPIPFKGLVCPAFISRRKNSLELARAAEQTGLPVKFIGGPAIEDESYIREFEETVSGSSCLWVGAVNDPFEMAAHYRGAMGMVLPSRQESQPLSILEALACGLPVMATGLKNIQSFYGEAIEYCRPAHLPGFEKELMRFGTECMEGRFCGSGFDVMSWDQVGGFIHDIYRSVMAD